MIYYTINTNNYIENLQAPSWVQVITDVEDLGDPVRSSRKDKILCPFEGPSVYIDASKVHLLNDDFKKLSEEIIGKGGFTYMEHPHKHSYLEECAEYVKNGWVDPDDILRFTNDLSKIEFNFEEYFSPLCTIIWRSWNDHEFNKTWWEWYNKGGVRDQLSFSVAFQLVPQKCETVYSRDLINQFSDANPGGEWWNNKSGDYHYHKEDVDIIEFVDLLTEITGLYNWKKYFRSGTHRITGESFYGDAGPLAYSIQYDDVNNDQLVIYTSITNWYDTIPDDMYYDPDVKYVCFTDGKVEKKGEWEFRDIPEFVYDEVEGDPRRLSAFAKICPHKLFPNGTKTVWLDGCYVHTKEWVDYCKKKLKESGLTHMLHPHRFTFHNEIMEGFGANFNSREQMLELVDALSKVNYDFKKYCSPVLTCIWRQIDDEMGKFHDLWWKYSKIGSNRDQISFDCALQLTGIKWWVVHNWETIGLDLTSSVSKSARNKRHPQAGHFDESSTYSEILEECYELLKEIRPITGIDDEHQIWKLEANELRDPTYLTWLPEGSWWYDPTTIKTTNGKYSVQDKVILRKDKGGTMRNEDSGRNNSFWVRRLKRSLGIVDLPNESYITHVWDWGTSFRDYVTKNVLTPQLPKT
jgi:hypothetical protein